MSANLYKQHILSKWQHHTSSMQATGYDNLLISSGNLLYPFRDDLNYPYKTNPYFLEWVYLQDRPASILHIDITKDRPILFIKDGIDFWDTAPADIAAEIAQHIEIQFYTSQQQLHSQFKNLSAVAYIGEPCSLTESIEMDVNPEMLLNRIDFARADKTPYEHQCLREATTIAARGHQAAKQAFISGKSEYGIHMDYLQAISCVDAELPYGNIIALNENAATLHHMQLVREKPAKHLSLLIDAGADYRGYAADITRTYTQQSDSLFSELISGVTNLQQQIISNIKPGIQYADLHHQAHQLIGKLLAELDIAKPSEDKEINLSVSKTFFPHGLGHLLGVQVHDLGGRLDKTTFQTMPPNDVHPHLRFTRTIEANMVFTIEPGVYFIPSLLEELKEKHASLINWNLVEQLIPFGGVRIEDNIIVHKNNIENVTVDTFSKTQV